MTYEELEHTADVKVRVKGRSIEDLYAESVRALMEVMYVTCIGKGVEREIDVSAEGEVELIHDFLSEVLYAYSSTVGNNGSAFAGIGVNNPYYNVTLSLAMLIGRFIVIVPALAIAGSLGAKTPIPPSVGTFATNNTTFVVLLVITIVVLAGLNFFPALTLGPVLEHLEAGRLRPGERTVAVIGNGSRTSPRYCLRAQQQDDRARRLRAVLQPDDARPR